MDSILSKDNARFKLAKSLLIRKHRDTHHLCIIEGARLVNHIKELHPDWIQMVFLELSCSETLLLKYPEAVLLSDVLFKELSDTVHSQGVIALVKTDMREDALQSSLILALDGIQDPGNLGTILRTCDAVGDVDAILSKGCVDLYNPKVLRSAMGSMFDVTVKRNCPLPETLFAMKESGYKVVGAALDGAENLLDFTWQPQTILVIGNEGNGISEEVLKLCDVRVKIPLGGNAESLNAAIAAGILLYDAHRNLKPSLAINSGLC